MAFLTIGKISAQKASFVCVKNNGSSGAEQLLPSQSVCRHHEQVLCENTLFSKSANNSCCLGLNLLRVCRYKVLLCNARRFLQLSVVWPILWQNPHVMDVCEDTPGSLFGGVLGFPLPLYVTVLESFSFAFEVGFPFPFPFRPIKVKLWGCVPMGLVTKATFSRFAFLVFAFTLGAFS